MNKAVEHHEFIIRCIELASDAKRMSNYPFGALLALDGKVLIETMNTSRTDCDATRHAEMNLVSLACRHLSQKEISSATLYSSTEPCVMCSGAIYWAGINKVVYGCSESSLAQLIRTDKKSGVLGIPCRDILGGHGIDVIGPVLEQQAIDVHRGFWEPVKSLRHLAFVDTFA